MSAFDFRKYLEQSLDEEYEELLIKYKENDSFNSKQLLTYAGLRWSYDDTVRRGVYHTQDCWIERNILSFINFFLNSSLLAIEMTK